MATFRIGLLCSSALLAVWGLPAFAADLAGPAVADRAMPEGASTRQAVAGINGKIEVFGGGTDGDAGRVGGWMRGKDGPEGALAGSLSIPVGHSLGLQIDGLAATRGDAFSGGGGAHLFWRDPARGLLGLYGSTFHSGDIDWTRTHAGVEAEGYFGRVTLAGIVGQESNRGDGLASISGSRSSRFFDVVDAKFYVHQDVKLSLGHRYVDGLHAAALGAEYLFHPGSRMAVSGFVEGRFAEENNRAVWAGIKVYFGNEDKSLMRRHREDDPQNYMADLNYLSARPKAVVLPPPAPPAQCAPCCGELPPPS